MLLPLIASALHRCGRQKTGAKARDEKGRNLVDKPFDAGLNLPPIPAGRGLSAAI
ncbi:MAG: hypothetical protein K6E30_03020 [Lachnospiraceae bacterium]|nr:hypothetical protein [Lachnospiraceae bacterium]